MGRDLTVAVQHCKDNTVDNHRTTEADGFIDDLTVVDTTTSSYNTGSDLIHTCLNHYPGGRQVKIAIKLLSGLAVVAVLVCGLIFASHDYGVYRISTGSMRPQLPVGSVLIVHKTHTDFKKGDVISFHETNGQIVSHRFIGIDKKTGGIMTKGDANLTPDVHFTPLRNKDVVGKVVRHTDVFAFSFWRTWRGVAIMLLLLVIGWTLFSKTDEAPKTENENEDEKESDEKEDQPADASTPV